MTHAAAEAVRSSAPTPQPRDDAPAAPSPLCPYCGHEQSASDAAECEACRGLFEPLSRQATQNAMGPWQVRDARNPFLPGCSSDVVRALALRGRLTADSIIRGPTTGQFWQRAGRTPCIAHLLGFCHACAAAVRPTDALCVSCGARFTTPTDRQFLGIGPARPLHAAPAPSLEQPVPHSPAADERHELSVFDAIPSATVRESSTRGALPRPAVAALIFAGAAVVVAAVIAVTSLATRPDVPSPPPAPEPSRPATVPAAAADDATRSAIRDALLSADDESAPSLRAAIDRLRDIRAAAKASAPPTLEADIAGLERRLDAAILRQHW